MSTDLPTELSQESMQFSLRPVDFAVFRDDASAQSGPIHRLILRISMYVLFLFS